MAEEGDQRHRPADGVLKAPRRPDRERRGVRERPRVERSHHRPGDPPPDMIQGERHQHRHERQAGREEPGGWTESRIPLRHALRRDSRERRGAEVVPGEEERPGRQEEQAPATLGDRDDDAGHGEREERGAREEAELLVEEQAEMAPVLDRRPGRPVDEPLDCGEDAPPPGLPLDVTAEEPRVVDRGGDRGGDQRRRGDDQGPPGEPAREAQQERRQHQEQPGLDRHHPREAQGRCGGGRPGQGRLPQGIGGRRREERAGDLGEGRYREGHAAGG